MTGRLKHHPQQQRHSFHCWCSCYLRCLSFHYFLLSSLASLQTSVSVTCNNKILHSVRHMSSQPKNEKVPAATQSQFNTLTTTMRLQYRLCQFRFTPLFSSSSHDPTIPPSHPTTRVYPASCHFFLLHPAIPPNDTRLSRFMPLFSASSHHPTQRHVFIPLHATFFCFIPRSRPTTRVYPASCHFFLLHPTIPPNDTCLSCFLPLFSASSRHPAQRHAFIPLHATFFCFIPPSHPTTRVYPASCNFFLLHPAIPPNDTRLSRFMPLFSASSHHPTQRHVFILLPATFFCFIPRSRQPTRVYPASCHFFLLHPAIPPNDTRLSHFMPLFSASSRDPAQRHVFIPLPATFFCFIPPSRPTTRVYPASCHFFLLHRTIPPNETCLSCFLPLFSASSRDPAQRHVFIPLRATFFCFIPPSRPATRVYPASCHFFMLHPTIPPNDTCLSRFMPLFSASSRHPAQRHAFIPLHATVFCFIPQSHPTTRVYPASCHFFLLHPAIPPNDTCLSRSRLLVLVNMPLI